MSTLSTAESYLAPLLPGLSPVAATQAGVCPICRSAPNKGYPTCFPCRDQAPLSVVPIAMSAHGGQLHRHLRMYKDGTRQQQETFSARLAALVAIFLRNHGPCLGEFDAVAAVPSADRDATEPIRRLVRRLNKLTNVLGCDPNGHLNLTADVSGRRVLLFDDTFTRGTTIFAANDLLVSSGATVVGPLVIGRHIHHNYEPTKALYQCVTSTPWQPGVCARCGGIDCPDLRTNLFG